MFSLPGLWTKAGLLGSTKASSLAITTGVLGSVIDLGSRDKDDVVAIFASDVAVFKVGGGGGAFFLRPITRI